MSISMTASGVPFFAEHELYHKLSSYGSHGLRTKPLGQVEDRLPYPLSSPEICNENQRYIAHVPGHPEFALNETSLTPFLRQDLVTPDLNKLAPHLWLVAKEDSSHVSPLTKQLVRGRRIVITEDPQLHLVWIDDRIFLKPLPKYLLSRAFWEHFLAVSDERFSRSTVNGGQQSFLQHQANLNQAARGFLRTYTFLIRHRSDFELASNSEHRLLPKHIKYKDFIRFAKVCQNNISDADVSPRYNYGELRLTRLNFWSKIFLRKFTFHKVHGQYSAYFARFYGPLFFIFAILSLVLDSFQVELAAQSLLDSDGTRPFTITFSSVSKIITLIIEGLVGAVVLYLLSQLSALVLRETTYAFRRHWKRPPYGIGLENT